MFFHFSFVLSLISLISIFPALKEKKLRHHVSSAQARHNILHMLPRVLEKMPFISLPQPSSQGLFPSAAREPAALSSRLHTGMPRLSHSCRRKHSLLLSEQDRLSKCILAIFQKNRVGVKAGHSSFYFFFQL